MRDKGKAMFQGVFGLLSWWPKNSSTSGGVFSIENEEEGGREIWNIITSRGGCCLADEIRTRGE